MAVLDTIKLSDALKENHIPRASGYHSCIDNQYTTGARQTLAIGVRTLYTNNKLVYEGKSNGALWDSTNSKIDCGSSGLVEDSLLFIKLGGGMSAATALSRMKVELVIARPAGDGGEVPIDTFEIEFARNGVDILSYVLMEAYNGSYAVAYDLEIYLTAEGGAVDIWDKSILIGTP